jgi:ketosteroid isomerase-like protein
MLTKETALAFAHDWVESWNAHDLQRVLAHYTDDFEMTSPYIVSIANDANGTLKGKEKVAAYWATALNNFQICALRS